MTNKSKAKGTAAESAVVKYAKARGWDKAKRIALSGVNDKGDVELSDDVMVEVKAGHAAEFASYGQIGKWLNDTRREQFNGNWQFAFLITKRKGKGYLSVNDWFAWVRVGWTFAGHELPAGVQDSVICMRVGDLFDLLQVRGYGPVIQA